MLKKRPADFQDCLKFARMKFEKLFNHDIRQLMHVYPLDSKTKEGNLFWSLPKRPPQPINFDPKNELHQRFIAAVACLRASIFFIEIPSKEPRSDDFRKECAEQANTYKPAAFVANDAKAKEIQDQVDKAGKKEEEEEKKEQPQQENKPEEADEVEKQLQELAKILPTLKYDKKKPVEEVLIKKEDFEKDDDKNYHIDLIYSMANCRSSNYKLDAMDWLTVKLKAGRIVPALATTTAAIAGLQTLEMVKVIVGVKKVDYKNIFLNLAVPFL